MSKHEFENDDVLENEVDIEESFVEDSEEVLESDLDADFDEVEDQDELHIPPAFVEQLADQLMIGQLAEVVINLREQVVAMKGVIEVITDNQAKLENDFAELSTFVSKAEHSLTRAQGFPVATEEVPNERMPELPYANILSNLQGSLEEQLNALSPLASESAGARKTEKQKVNGKTQAIRNVLSNVPKVNQPFSSQTKKDQMVAELSKFVKEPASHWDQ